MDEEALLQQIEAAVASGRIRTPQDLDRFVADLSKPRPSLGERFGTQAGASFRELGADLREMFGGRGRDMLASLPIYDADEQEYLRANARESRATASQTRAMAQRDRANLPSPTTRGEALTDFAGTAAPDMAAIVGTTALGALAGGVGAVPAVAARAPQLSRAAQMFGRAVTGAPKVGASVTSRAGLQTLAGNVARGTAAGTIASQPLVTLPSALSEESERSISRASTRYGSMRDQMDAEGMAAPDGVVMGALDKGLRAVGRAAEPFAGSAAGRWGFDTALDAALGLPFEAAFAMAKPLARAGADGLTRAISPLDDAGVDDALQAGARGAEAQVRGMTPRMPSQQVDAAGNPVFGRPVIEQVSPYQGMRSGDEAFTMPDVLPGGMVPRRGSSDPMRHLNETARTLDADAGVGPSVRRPRPQEDIDAEIAANQARRQAEREAAQQAAELQRAATQAAAEAHRVELGRGAARSLGEPLQDETTALRARMSPNAPTTGQDAALQALRARGSAAVGAAGTGAAIGEMAGEEGDGLDAAMMAAAPMALWRPGKMSRRMLEQGAEQLYGVHNFRANALLGAMREGRQGLAAPSTAVTVPRVGMDLFGDNSLILKNPFWQNRRTYSGDGYVPTQSAVARANLISPDRVRRLMTAPVFSGGSLNEPASVTPQQRAIFEQVMNEAVAKSPQDPMAALELIETAVARGMDTPDMGVLREMYGAAEFDNERRLLREDFVDSGGTIDQADEQMRENAILRVAHMIGTAVSGDRKIRTPDGNWLDDTLENQALAKTAGEPRGAIIDAGLRHMGMSIGPDFNEYAPSTTLEAAGATIVPFNEMPRHIPRLQSHPDVLKANEAADKGMMKTISRLRGVLGDVSAPDGTDAIARGIFDAYTKGRDRDFFDPNRYEPFDFVESLLNSGAVGFDADETTGRKVESLARQLARDANKYGRGPAPYLEQFDNDILRFDRDVAGVMMSEDIMQSPRAATAEMGREIAERFDRMGVPVMTYDPNSAKNVSQFSAKAQAAALKQERDAYVQAVTQSIMELGKSGRLQAAALTTLPAVASAVESDEAQGRYASAGLDALDWTLLGAAAGVPMAISLAKRAATMGATKGAAAQMQRDLTKVATEIATQEATRARWGRALEREARDAARIRDFTAPYPADVADPVRDTQSLLAYAGKIITDAGGTQEMREVAEQAVTSGQITAQGRVPWEVEEQLADLISVNVKDLATRNPDQKLSGTELLALGKVYTRDVRRKAMAAEAMRDMRLPPEQRQLAAQLHEALEERTIGQFQRLTRDRSQSGRDLNLLKKAWQESSDPQEWLYRAQRLAGGRVLSDDLTREIIEALNAQDFVRAQIAVGKARKGTLADKAADLFQTNLLGTLSRSFRDIISNATQTIDKAGQYKLAGYLDRAIAPITKVRTAGANTRLSRKLGEASQRGVQQAIALLRGGAATPEQMEALRRAAARYDFMGESSFENPIMRAYTTVVRRTVAAADQPFYEMGFTMSIESQAMAMAEAGRLRGKELLKAADGFAANPTPEMLRRASEDALETVWQNKTWLGDIAKSVGQRNSKNPYARLAGKLMIPFAQTPSSMQTQAIMQTPFGAIGAAMDAAQMARGIDLPEHQRKLVKKLAGMGTGAAWMFLGYQAMANGKMTGEFPVDQQERSEFETTGKLPNALLVGGKWVALSGLLGPQAILMAIGAELHNQMQAGLGEIAGGAMATVQGSTRALMDSPVMQGLDATMRLMTSVGSGDQQRVNDAADRFASSYAGGVVPGLVRQAASAMDGDEMGRVIGRDLTGTDLPGGRAQAAIMSAIPGLREQLPAKRTVFGETVRGGPAGMTQMVSPFRTRLDQSDDLTRILSESGYFPTSPKPRGPNKTSPELDAATIRELRIAEGPEERALLEGILANDEAALSYVTDDAMEEYAATNDLGVLFQRAIQTLRSRRSRESLEPQTVP